MESSIYFIYLCSIERILTLPYLVPFFVVNKHLLNDDLLMVGGPSHEITCHLSHCCTPFFGQNTFVFFI